METRSSFVHCCHSLSYLLPSKVSVSHCFVLLFFAPGLERILSTCEFKGGISHLGSCFVTLLLYFGYYIGMEKKKYILSEERCCTKKL